MDRFVASIVVSNYDQYIGYALKLRTSQYDRSAEAEHRGLLEQMLLRPGGKHFAVVTFSIDVFMPLLSTRKQDYFPGLSQLVGRLKSFSPTHHDRDRLVDSIGRGLYW